MTGFTMVSGVLPKSTVGRKAIPAKPELVSALLEAFDSGTAEVINSDGDLAPSVYGPDFLFESETKARTDAKRYVAALKESGRLCTTNVYPIRENYVGKILDAEGNTVRFQRVFGANEAEAVAALEETLEEGQSAVEVEAQARYAWRLYVPLSGEDGGRTEPVAVVEEEPEDDPAEDDAEEGEE